MMKSREQRREPIRPIFGYCIIVVVREVPAILWKGDIRTRKEYFPSKESDILQGNIMSRRNCVVVISVKIR
jgi:hypothetical protein